MRYLFILVVSIAFVACNGNGDSSSLSIPEIKLTGESMGTTYSIIYMDSSQKNHKLVVDKFLLDMNSVFSVYDRNSAISRINEPYAKYSISRYTVEVMKKAKEVYENTGGAFDPTVGPLVSAWGFNGSERVKVPSQEQVDSLLALKGIDAFTIDELDYELFIKYFLNKSRPEVQLDFNGIVKGYVVDELCKKLDTLGATHYMVEIGGEVRTKGNNEKGEPWRIGINRPAEDAGQEVQQVVVLQDMAMATSGNYRNFYELDGKKYVHTINPHTGYPEQNSLLSATVFAEDCMTADAYATAFMVMGLDKAYELSVGEPLLEAYFIYGADDGSIQVKYTPGAERFLAD